MARQSCLAEKYVWEIPVRVSHWVNFLAIIILSVTGYYIGSPKSLGLTPADYVMGWVRFVHFTTGFIFAVSVASRIYWAFVGNRYARWREFFPLLSREGRQNAWATFKFYTFLTRKVPHPPGHNALAGMAYSMVFLLYLVMIGSGFALYAEHAPGGVMHLLATPLYALFSDQGLRLTHHLVMWLLIAFAIHHVYSAWLMDIKERCGVISSMFSGYKAMPKE
ncbi:Ni/Fe-hydrogenase, b-type cytochrome subunit [Geotalea uraniireducens]|uniref:Ni/Fe-hydrogenase, b-type cytochrome subunit n=1 Tax=Geotalea uraniireducens TaxID=351604 RepID=A0ABM7P1I1_9BACT|nr:Ni/Fe-hydrogenase, b-type cytochrome subunit [Geotalea uraniireducens]BDV44734.1 Ni/Fe-hydrogenase, b-type cytochrome subunit [Geotalea uraniireducens]